MSSDEQSVDKAHAEEASNAVPAFQFPFSPDAYAPKKNASGVYPQPGKCDHTKHPGMAPRGTRRSMGKR